MKRKLAAVELKKHLGTKTSLNRCHTHRFSDVCGESSDETKFWTFFPPTSDSTAGA
ncbi:unnamed protein product [Ranitomeya imitator]|uniref:Uncharacterized protein n=1 Tax=Ranitomeya imitator TaxID=111125 RepID=A0ABN9KQI8_9NEOB|nr:unnamed protein product [Ranitomeya imitator]